MGRWPRGVGRFSAPVLLVVLLSLVVGAVAQGGVGASGPGRSGTDPKGVCTTSSTSTSTTPTGAGDPFKGVCDYLAGRKGVAQVGLFNANNGTTYLLSNGDDTQYTASMVKVDILALWLHNYQMSGTKIPDDIPYSIKYIMGQMIDFSDNAAATALFHFGGGCNALTAFNNLIPLTDTKVVCESANYYGWGNTTTIAADQVALMRIYAYGGRDDVLATDARSYGLSLMEMVDPTQRWGISCGPWGTTCDAPNYATPKSGVTLALKNGWKTLPTCTLTPTHFCPWQVNSTGWVGGEGRNYVLTVLTTDDPAGDDTYYGMTYGIETIQNISKIVWANLA